MDLYFDIIIFNRLASVLVMAPLKMAASKCCLKDGCLKDGCLKMAELVIKSHLYPRQKKRGLHMPYLFFPLRKHTLFPKLHQMYAPMVMPGNDIPTLSSVDGWGRVSSLSLSTEPGKEDGLRKYITVTS